MNNSQYLDQLYGDGTKYCPSCQEDVPLFDGDSCDECEAYTGAHYGRCLACGDRSVGRLFTQWTDRDEGIHDTAIEFCEKCAPAIRVATRGRIEIGSCMPNLEVSQLKEKIFNLYIDQS